MNEVNETLRNIEVSISTRYKLIDTLFKEIDELKKDKKAIMDKYNIPYDKEESSNEL